jgi:hypothetical protein
MRINTSIVLSCLILVVLPQRMSYADDSSLENDREVKQFVQNFYDWYVPLSRGTYEQTFIQAVVKRRTQFTLELAEALTVDDAAQAKDKNEIIGLDFEPFTSSQDPCEKYVAGSVRKKVNWYRVDIFSICDGKRSEKPELVAEVARVNDRLVFANFRYENGADLIGILHSLANERKIKK